MRIYIPNNSMNKRHFKPISMTWIIIRASIHWCVGLASVLHHCKNRVRYQDKNMSSCDASFGSSGQSFAHLSSDNRLHLWDVASKKLKKSYVEKNHLTHSFKCYNWKSSKDTPGTFVVGYSDGIVVVWDLNRGVVAQTIGNAKESQTPTDVVLSRDGKNVYVSSDLNNIVQYDISNGSQISSIKTGKKGVQKLAMNPKVDVIAAAGSSIKLIDIASGQKRKLEASFAGGISTLTFTPCGRFLAASSARTRELLVFDTRADAGSDAPVYVLPVRGVLTAVVARTSTNKETMQFLCVFEDSGAYIFELDVNYSKNESSGVNSVRSETNIVSVEPIVAGCFGSAGQPEAPGVSLVLGSKSSPVFKYVDISANEREIVLQDASQKSATVNGSTSKNGAESTLFAPEVLGPHEMGGVKRPIVSTENGEQNKRSKTENGSMITASGDSSELTLEARLESLSSSLAALEDRAGAKKGDNAGALLPAPTSDSMVTLIDQALQSGDDGLLEQCLSCADADIVEATARRLPTSRVVLFLRKLVAKFEKRPSRGVLLTQWLSALLRHHTAYLVTVPDLSYQLAGLSQMLEQRLGSYSKLSSLAGRLDLLMSQVSYRSDDHAAEVPNGLRGMAEITPMAVFQEE